MSKFLGITFADQNVQPSDDAAVRRAALSDGFLYGCELSYAGSTLTMAAGQILACGRQFEHPTSNNWAVVDATSGYARLLLTIDLSRTSTEDAFDQVTDTIEYATSVDGFPELEQEDINTSGLRYQVVACVVSLGTGGITGIVKQLGRSYARPAVKRVWENADASSEIAAHNMVVDWVSEYDIYFFVFRNTITSSNKTIAMCRRGDSMSVQVMLNLSSSVAVEFAQRIVTVSTNGYIGFSDATGKPASGDVKTNNKRLIPIEIYGWRGVIE